MVRTTVAISLTWLWLATTSAKGAFLNFALFGDMVQCEGQ
jgi:hypothetical protein